MGAVLVRGAERQGEAHKGRRWGLLRVRARERAPLGRGPRAPRGVTRLRSPRTRAPRLARWMGAGRRWARVRLLRRPGQLRPPCAQVDMAVRGGRPPARLGLVDPRAAEPPGLRVPLCRRAGRQAGRGRTDRQRESAARDREPGDADSFSRSAVVDGAKCSAEADGMITPRSLPEEE